MTETPNPEDTPQDDPGARPESPPTGEAPPTTGETPGGPPTGEVPLSFDGAPLSDQSPDRTSGPRHLPPYVGPPPVRKRRGRLIAGAVGLVAVAGAAIFAVTSLSGGDDGAATPEAAVEALLDAAANEDLIGVMEALPPGERSALRGGVEDLASELQRLGILSDDFDLGGVSGFDIAFEGVELESEPLGEGVSLVEVTAGVTTGTTVADEAPLGETITDALEDQGISVEFESSTESESLVGTRVVAIEEGGGWHVSLFYSVAELARLGAAAPVPDFGNGIEPDGADSPEGAIRALAERSADLDVEGMLALLPPDEMRVIHDYAPLFIDEAIAELAETREQIDITIDDIGVEVEGDDDTRTVTIQSFAMSGTTPDGEIDISWDGDCFEADVDGDQETICASELGETFGIFEGSFIGAATGGGFVVVERDGEWFVSPTRTIFGLLTAFLQTIDREDIENFDDFLEGLFEFEEFEEVGSVIESDATTTTTPVTPSSTTTTTAGEDATTSTIETPTTSVGSGDLLDPIDPDEFVFDGESLDTESDCSGTAPEPTTCYALAESCFDGDMTACDDLYFSSDFGSAFEAYGATCAGRVPDNPVTCIEAVGPTAPN